MPPKRKVQVVDDDENKILLPPRLTAKDIQVDWDDVGAGEYFCRIIVNEIVSEMEHEIVRAHMDHTAVPWTVQSVLTDLMESIQLNFIEREPDEVHEEDSPDVEIDIDEPQVTDADSWARGSMLQRTPLVKADSDQFTKAAKTRPSSRGDSAKTRDSSDPLNATTAGLTPMNNNPSFVGSSGFLSSGGVNGASSGTNNTNMTRSTLGAGLSVNTRAGGGRRASEAKSSARTEADTALDVMLRTEEEVKQMERQKAAAERMTHLRSVADRLNKQFTEIRNPSQTPFVVDGKTNSILPVNKVDPKKLPHTAEPKVKPDPDDLPPEEPLNQSRGGRRGGPAAGLSSSSMSYPLRPDAKKSRPKKPDASNFFEAEQPKPSMVQGVQPSPGVLSRENDSVKRSELKPQKSRITKQEFGKIMVSQQQQQARAAESNKDGEQILEGMVGSAPMIQPGEKRPASSASSTIHHQRGGSGAAQRGSGKVSTLALPKKAASDSILAQPAQKTQKPKPKKSRSPSPTRKLSTPQRIRREGDIPETLPTHEAPERVQTPSKSYRTNPVSHVPRPNNAHVPLSEINNRARASTPEIVQAKDRAKRLQKLRNTMHVATEEDTGEVSELAAEFFSDVRSNTSSQF